MYLLCYLRMFSSSLENKRNQQNEREKTAQATSKQADHEAWLAWIQSACAHVEEALGREERTKCAPNIHAGLRLLSGGPPLRPHEFFAHTRSSAGHQDGLAD